MSAVFTNPLELSTLNGANGIAINGVSSGDQSGWSVASAGDINGDGIGDFVISAYLANPGGRADAGTTYLVFGHQTSWSATLDLSSLNGSNGFAINGVASSGGVGDYSGYSVASAGDINGDGIGDLVIGANQASPASRTGVSYVVFGKQTAWSATLELSTLNGVNGFAIKGVNIGDNSGWSVASAGDMNGDGISDIIIGAVGAAPGGRTNAGASYVVFGKQILWSASFELSSLDGVNGFVINGVNSGDISGSSVASAGDVNGDGIGDIIIGAFDADPGARISAGASYVVFGKQTPWSASLELSSLNGVNGFVINGVNWYENSGYSVASLGDINGDGVSDIIIGAYQGYQGTIYQAGVSYVVFGKQTPWSPSLELSILNGVNGFTIHGEGSGDYSGWSVASAGDMNGDGIKDIIIGAPQAYPGGRSNAGVSYIIFGKKTIWDASFNTTIGLAINGINPANTNIFCYDQSGSSVASAGDVNGDGIGDVLIGAPYACPGNHPSAGVSYVIFGKNLTSIEASTGMSSSTAGSSTGISTQTVSSTGVPIVSSTATTISSTADSSTGIFTPTVSSSGVSAISSTATTFSSTASVVASSTGTSAPTASSSGVSAVSSTATVMSSTAVSVASSTGTSTQNSSSSAGSSPVSSTATQTSSAARNKPWVLDVVQGAFSLASLAGSFGTELLSNINPFSMGRAAESNIGIGTSSASSTKENSSDDSASKTATNGNGFKVPTLSVNDYLAVVVPYATHYIQKYSPFTLPWNKVHALSNDEIKTLEKQQIALKASAEARQNQRASRAERSGMFADKSQFIDTQLKALRTEMTTILQSKQASSTQLSDITSRLQHVDERIHELSKLNKSLKHLDIKADREIRRRPHSQSLAKIEHDSVSGKLKQRFVAAESAEGIGMLYNAAQSTQTYSSASKPLLFSSFAAPQNRVQQPICKPLLENIPMRKAKG